MDGTPEDLEEVGEGAKAAAFWEDQIRLAGKVEERWHKEAVAIVRRYEDQERESGTRLNVFHANVETLKPALFSRTPQPSVRRRNIHEEPDVRKRGLKAALVLEKALTYAIDDYSFTDAMESVRDDALIVGRGVAREAYEFERVRRDDVQVVRPAMPVPGTIDEMVLLAITPPPPPSYFLDGQLVEPDFDKEGAPYVEQIVNERVETRYVFWSDFRMSPARRWDDVWWVAFRHTPTKAEMTDDFGFGRELAGKIPLTIDADPTAEPEHRMPDPKGAFKRAELWEIWNKRTRERIWIATGHKDLVRKDEDPLGLAGFFPMAKPLYVIRSTHSMVPIAEFTLYEDQADELDRLQARICGLAEQCIADGICDAEAIELLSLENSRDGQFHPMQRRDESASSLRDAIWERPLQGIVIAIQQLTSRAEMVKQQVYEITGITDLRRGSGTRERESATAQDLKAGYGLLRMTPRSKPMAEFVRDTLRIKAEIMAEHFQPESLEMQAGMTIEPDVIALLKNEHLRHTTVDIETDSTVAPDVQAEKAEAFEFMTGVTEYLTAVAPIVQMAPQLAPMFMAMLKAGTKPFKFGREFEDVIDQTADQVADAAAQATQAPPMPGNGAEGQLTAAMLQPPGALQ